MACMGFQNMCTIAVRYSQVREISLYAPFAETVVSPIFCTIAIACKCEPLSYPIIIYELLRYTFTYSVMLFDNRAESVLFCHCERTSEAVSRGGATRS